MFTFVTGGLRSGKSEYAIRRASEMGPPPWLYVAADLDGDDELKARLVGHRKDQDASWKLIAAPDALSAALEPAQVEGCGALVIDRLTVWLSNRLSATDKSSDKALLGEVEVLADRLYRSTTPGVLVTTEIGLGFLPTNVPDRRLIDIAGMANQILSDRAESVVLMVSGVALRLR
ncbi:MAG TPA: bifunctional adenosylcobinamide kinase/adenosylcobinamide-phosphate guanylyltransferase [Polyangia bacterium]